MPPDKVKDFGKDSAFGRPAMPAELAPLYVWLHGRGDKDTDIYREHLKELDEPDPHQPPV